MMVARDEIHYALPMYVDYKSRDTSLSVNFRAPKRLTPDKFGVSVSTDADHGDIWTYQFAGSDASRICTVRTPLLSGANSSKAA